MYVYELIIYVNLFWVFGKVTDPRLDFNNKRISIPDYVYRRNKFCKSILVYITSHLLDTQTAVAFAIETMQCNKLI